MIIVYVLFMLLFLAAHSFVNNVCNENKSVSFRIHDGKVRINLINS